MNTDDAITPLQAKQRRKDRKEKDKEAEEKRVRVEQESRQRPSDVSRSKERLLKERNILLLTPADVGDEEDDLSGLDTVDDVIVGTFGPATEYGDVDRTSWEREGPYSQSGMEDAGFSGAVLEEGSTRNGRIGRKHQAAILDDSSSTCSTDSLPSVRPCMNGSCNSGPSVPEHNHTVASRYIFPCKFTYLQTQDYSCGLYTSLTCRLLLLTLALDLELSLKSSSLEIYQPEPIWDFIIVLQKSSYMSSKAAQCLISFIIVRLCFGVISDLPFLRTLL